MYPFPVFHPTNSSNDAQRIASAVWAVSIHLEMHFREFNWNQAKVSTGYYYYCFNKHLQQTYQSSLKKKKKKNLTFFPGDKGITYENIALQYKEWCDGRQHSNWRLFSTRASCLFLTRWLVLPLPGGLCLPCEMLEKAAAFLFQDGRNINYSLESCGMKWDLFFPSFPQT